MFDVEYVPGSGIMNLRWGAVRLFCANPDLVENLVRPNLPEGVSVEKVGKDYSVHFSHVYIAGDYWWREFYDD
jgi:hypothetical protein